MNVQSIMGILRKAVRYVACILGFRMFDYIIGLAFLGVAASLAEYVVLSAIWILPVLITAFAFYFVVDLSKPAIKLSSIIMFAALWFVTGFFTVYGRMNSVATILHESILPESIGIILVSLIKYKNIRVAL